MNVELDRKLQHAQAQELGERYRAVLSENVMLRKAAVRSLLACAGVAPADLDTAEVALRASVPNVEEEAVRHLLERGRL